jgi:hypothetical protein
MFVLGDEAFAIPHSSSEMAGASLLNISDLAPCSQNRGSEGGNRDANNDNALAVDNNPHGSVNPDPTLTRNLLDRPRRTL